MPPGHFEAEIEEPYNVIKGREDEGMRTHRWWFWIVVVALLTVVFYARYRFDLWYLNWMTGG